ncbi:MAG: shikimate kinase [Eubacteriales bacterium]|nr:shikimate kinase [Eubacteriales bacterium]
MNLRQNLILIGMPGSGKSTIGRLIAQKLDWPYLDTDQMIKDQQQRPLQEILDSIGVGAFIRLEATIVSSLVGEQQVIATGGSVVLDAPAMRHLRDLGRIVYLDVPLPKIERRLWNIKTRGIVIKKHQSIRDIYHIRRPLYERYADRIQSASGLSAQQIADEIVAWYSDSSETV